MSTKKPKRHVYVLEQRAMKYRTLTFVLTHGGGIVGWVPGTKRHAVQLAAKTLAEFADWFGQYSELRVRNRDGKIGETRTYPRSSDPRRSKG